jgi:hypothetical protein
VFTRAERVVYLPDAPFTATANILIAMPLPSNWAAFLSSLNEPHIFASEQRLGEVVTFISQANSSCAVTAERQLTLNLCSAQNQRQSLGFDNGYIFGATVVGNILTMYCSMWEYGKVVRNTISLFISILNMSRLYFQYSRVSIWAPFKRL